MRDSPIVGDYRRKCQGEGIYELERHADVEYGEIVSASVVIFPTIVLEKFTKIAVAKVVTWVMKSLAW